MQTIKFDDATIRVAQFRDLGDGAIANDVRQRVRRPRRSFRSIACLSGLLIAILPLYRVSADADDQFGRFLPSVIVSSTVPANGDVNPYGVAFVPADFPAGGPLNPGDILISNFNNSTNVQGTGTTIVKLTPNDKIAPNGQASVFFQGTAPLGLSTGLAVLKAGFVLVANCPTTGGNSPMAQPGSLLLIDRNGHLVDTLVDPAIQGPWDFTVDDDGNRVKVFVSNVLTGAVSRLDLLLNGGHVVVQRAVVIASGYVHRPDPVTFEVGPTGLVFDEREDILYVSSTGDNAVFAIKDAGKATQSQGTGLVIYKDAVHLHGALAMVRARNGHFLVSNSDGFNPDPNQPSEIVEFTKTGRFIGQFNVDAAQGGAFGIGLSRSHEDVVRLAVVDDNANDIIVYSLNR